MTKTQVITNQKETKPKYRIEMEHLYLLSELADKLQFEFPEFPDYELERKKMEENKMNKEEIEIKLKKMQNKYGKSVMLDLFKSMHKAKDEINNLITSITKRDVKTMSLKEIKDCFTEIINTDGVLDFFR